MANAGVLIDRLKRRMKGGAVIGSGDSNYLTISTAGAATQTGTGTGTWTGAHTFGSTVAVTGAASLASTVAVTGAASLASTVAVTGAASLASTVYIGGVATIAAAPVLSGSGRPTKHIWLGPEAFQTSGASVSAAVLNDRWNSIYFTPSASNLDISVYANVSIPEDMDVSVGITPRVYWSLGAKGASAVADWDLTVETIASGEVSGTASTADVSAGASMSASTANTIAATALGTIGAGVFVHGDILSLLFKLEGTDGKTTAGCPYFLGLDLDYSADTL